ncbi:MAG TPA: alpha/beta fold hydrolase [Gaiellaceae bacterium]|nr:alpha/beta fold hydrolase [Gaiellaceae bacterium]
MRLRYELDGPASEPVLALPSSLGTTLELWSENIPYWSDTFCVLSYDQPGRRTIAELGQDFLDLLDELGLERVSYCGLSLGGATGMWLAATAPERIERLVLACTSARFGEPDQWLERAALVRERGLEPIADSIVARWFTPAEGPELVERFREQLVATPREVYAACCEALAAWDFRGELTAIEAPTLVIAAADDSATPPAHAEQIARAIGTTKVVLPYAAHLANVEQAQAFSALVAKHLSSVEVA